MLQLLSDSEPFSIMEENYFRLRDKEGRIISDADLQVLPNVKADHPYADELIIRKQTLQIILNYLDTLQDKAKLQLMELGCGNGWLCHNIHRAGYAVSGVDVNLKELEQAARVFPEIPFYYADIFNSPQLGKFDLILVVAVLQYFPDPVKLIQHLKSNHLCPGGKIIIADTKLYATHQIPAAKERSVAYYRALGFPVMAEHYHHHNEEFLKDFNFKKLKKNTIFEKIGGFFGKKIHPFECILIE